MSFPEVPPSRREARDSGIEGGTPPGPRGNRRLIVIIVASAVVFVLLAVGAFFAGAAAGSRQTTAPSSGEARSGSSGETVSRPAPSVIPTSVPLASCSIDALATDPALGTFSGYVADADSGHGIFNRSGRDVATPSGTQLLLTATVALGVLGPDDTLKTKVFQGSVPGEIVLVGAGDPTLSRTPAGSDGVYASAPKLADLASQVTTALAGQPVTKIVLDASYWSTKDSWDSTWPRSARKTGTLSEVAALQVDGDRKDPTKQVSPRSTDPVINAGRYFRTALGASAAGASLEVGTATAGTAQLGEVDSQPVSTLVAQMLQSGDLTLAETLARVASKQSGADGSAASLQKVFTDQLTKLSLDTTGVVIHDGSGLSTKDLVAPILLTRLLDLIHSGTSGLDVVGSALATGGTSGLLADRFTGDGSAASGKVVAQAGSGTGESSLAGVVQAADGTELSFAFYAVKNPIPKGADAAIDALVAGLYTCGSNLSNH